MIISGTLTGPGETASSTSTPASPPTLTEGKILLGRISQVGPDGQGVVRFPNGSGLTFSGGQGLRVGEPVTLEVTRLSPEVTMRLVASESGSAANLAQYAEQSLMRAPDLLGKLMHWAGLNQNDKGALGRSAFMVSGRESLAGVLQRILPNVATEGLLKGDGAGLVRLLEMGSRQEVVDAVHLLRQASAGLRLEGGVEGGREVAAEVAVARNALQRLGDLLALQHILPQAVAPEDGGALLGYRLFWLTDGGLGEAIWRREKEKKGRGGRAGEESALSVLLSLNMTRLGMVQVRLVYGEGMLQVKIAARQEEALATLRQSIGELRQNLLAAELPLRILDLAMLGEGEMKAERVRALGMGAGFNAEV
ncbi:MAG: flagellar hook-length control protein FliK [Magnetococcales bacterium]|nr:flagellar hook-length control protein FliK [Magnetococcales bacterium]